MNGKGSKGIQAVEKEFASMVAKKGITEAFLHFAAENAVIHRNDKLIKGKAKIEAYFTENKSFYKHADLSWEPDYIDISES